MSPCDLLRDVHAHVSHEAQRCELAAQEAERGGRVRLARLADVRTATVRAHIEQQIDAYAVDSQGMGDRLSVAHATLRAIDDAMAGVEAGERALAASVLAALRAYERHLAARVAGPVPEGVFPEAGRRMRAYEQRSLEMVRAVIARGRV